MPGMALGYGASHLHAPSAAGGLWDCALLGKLARGVLAIDRLPGATAPNRGPSCTLHDKMASHVECLNDRHAKASAGAATVTLR